ncbi:MAG: DUF4250 domain-containing protein [Bacteroidaceae bacterium]
MNMPEDPMMLYSFINMKLRDCYPSLEELCEDLNLNQQEITQKLKSAGFEYNRALNKFY